MDFGSRTSPGCVGHLCADQPNTCVGRPAADSMTFGIELEFVVVAPKGSLTKTVPFHARNWAPVFLTHQAFLEHGVPTFCQGLVCDCAGCSHGWGRCIKGEVPAASENTAGGKYGRWVVQMDDSAKLTDDERQMAPESKCDTYSLELASRCFSTTADTDWQSEVANVLHIMTSTLSAHGCAVIANEKCGLHVHVGYGDAIVPLSTCKNVLQLMTSLERCFDQAHSTERMAPGPNFCPGGQGHFNANLGYLHRTRGWQENGAEYNIFDTLVKIEAASSHEEIGELFIVSREFEDQIHIESGHQTTVNFDNTWMGKKIFADDGSEINIDPIGTIEFRQHQSTLDVSVIAAFVGLLQALVNFCNDADNEKLIVQLCAQAWNRDFELLTLLHIIGCPGPALMHYQCLADGGQSHAPADPAAHFPRLVLVNALRNSYACSPKAVSARIGRKIQQGDYGKQVAVSRTDVDAVLGMPTKLAALQELAGRKN